MDNDSLICDFAEYYHIYDYMALDVQTMAILACGLPLRSRIFKRLNGWKIGLDEMLMAMQVDALDMLVWMKTKDAKSGTNRPKSIFELLTGEGKKDEEIMVFDSPEEFDAYIQQKEKNNGI